MTNDPLQILMIILLIAGFPLIVWVPSRLTDLMAFEEERVPESLRWFVNQKYLESVYEGKIIPKKSHTWKIFVAAMGLVLPVGILCTATFENLVPRLTVILASATVFFLAVALLGWLVRPRS